MIKLPEPFLVRHEDVCGDEVGPPTPCYTEAQLKQAVRDALTLAAARCKALDIGGNSDDYRNGAGWCVERIRALIKEIQ